MFDSDSAICFTYEVSIGIFYPSLLLLLPLAGLDRYLAITYYERYKKTMTNRKAIVAMLSSVGLNAILLDYPFWTGYQSASDCLFNLFHLFCIAIWCVVLGIINMVIQVKIFIVSRSCIRQYLINSPNNLPLRFGSSFQKMPSDANRPGLENLKCHSFCKQNLLDSR